jgi:hypothetical protein
VPVVLPEPEEDVSVLGVVVLGLVVVELLDEVEPVSVAVSFLPHADRDSAAIRTRAALCARGLLIIRTLLERCT